MPVSHRHACMRKEDLIGPEWDAGEPSIGLHEKEGLIGLEWDAGEPPTDLHEKGRLNWTGVGCR